MENKDSKSKLGHPSILGRVKDDFLQFVESEPALVFGVAGILTGGVAGVGLAALGGAGAAAAAGNAAFAGFLGGGAGFATGAVKEFQDEGKESTKGRGRELD